jgi:hypothetical protein
LKGRQILLVDAAMPPAVPLCLLKLVKSAMTKANTSVLLQTNLEATKAAEGD